MLAAEVEPNDSFGQAQVIPVSDGTYMIEGSTHSGGTYSIDYFKLSLTEGTTISTYTELGTDWVGSYYPTRALYIDGTYYTLYNGYQYRTSFDQTIYLSVDRTDSGTGYSKKGNPYTIYSYGSYNLSFYLNKAPSVMAVTTPAAGTYAKGQQITFCVAMSEPVTVSGSPALAMNFAGATRYASFSGYESSNELNFTYTVQEGDDLGGVSAGTLTPAITSGSIVDSQGNSALRGFSAPSMTGIRLGGPSPTASSITAPTGLYGIGMPIDVILHMSEAVTVDIASGTPKLPLTIGTATADALYVSGSGTANLVFRFVPSAASPSGAIGLGEAVVLDGGIIESTASKMVATTTLPGNLTTDAAVDAVAPTIAITSEKSALKAGEPATIAFTLSESATDFTAGDVTVSGGTLSKFAGSGVGYTATFTPTAASTSPGSISIAASKFTDTAGNPNTASDPLALSIDTVVPTIVMTSNKSALKAGETATITITLSESAGDFGEDDVTISGGTLSNFAGTGSSYTATFTPTAASTAAGSISVAAAKFTDAAGNDNTASDPLALTIETVVPTIAITSDKATLKAGETAAITFTLSESAADFSEDDVTVSGGTLSNFAGTGASYTATFTPTTASTTAGSISVAAAKFTDAAGNANTASDQLALAIDTIVPTIVITSNNSALKVGETATITFTLSDSAGDFGEDDVSISGGTLSNFAGTGASYTATFTPTTASTAAGSISVATAKFTDAAGNANTASDPLAFTIDTVVPTIVITSDKATLKTGETATITFTLSESATDFGEDDVTVSGGTLSNFSGTGASYTATFTPTASSTTPASISVAAAKFTDAAGNANTASDPLSLTIDTVVPTITITSDKATLKTGETATITFTLSESATDFGENDVTVSGGTLSNFSGTGASYTATFTPTASSTTAGSISVAAAKFTDAAGNDNTASDPLSVTVDTLVPTIVITSDKLALKAGETATITFTLGESASDFGDDDVTVSGGTLSNFAGSGASYTATFTPTAASTATGSISVSAAKFADAAGNANTASDQLALAIDTLVPTIVITSNKAALKAGETATITFTLSEASITFSSADVAVSGGTLSNFSGTGATYTATFTPTAASTTPGSLRVAAGKFTDAAGNANAAGDPLAVTIDTALPTATLTTVPAAGGGAITSVAVAFGEPVQGLRLADFQLMRNGAVVPLSGAAVTGSGRTWTVTGVAPLTSSLGTYVFSLRGDAAARDLAGNPLAAGASRSWTYATPFEIVGLPATTTAAISTITFRLNGPVKGFEKVDIRLSLNGQPVSLLRANLEFKRGVYELSGLGPLTQANGTYTVTVGRPNSKMLDGNGKPIKGVLQASWVKRR